MPSLDDTNQEVKRYCPCGRPLVRKENESTAAFGKRIYCNPAHKGLYHKTTRGCNFGLEFVKSRQKVKVGPGMLKYLYGKPTP